MPTTPADAMTLSQRWTLRSARRHHAWCAGLLTAAAALAMAGCGQTKGPEVATAQGPTATASGGETSSASAKESDYDKARRYIGCMNDNGENLPDPGEGKPLP